METTEDTIALAIVADPELIDLGVVETAIYQAETAENPTERPFITIRWGESERGIGPVNRKNFDVWVYDNFGDFDRARKVARRIGKMLDVFPQTQTAEGWITRIEDQGTGGDFADDGYKCLVVPQHLRAVASGI